jgi:hypothetical protein
VILGAAPLRIGRTPSGDSWLSGLEFAVNDAAACVDFELRVAENVKLLLARVRLERVTLRSH